MTDEIREKHESNRAAWSEAAKRYADEHDESVAFLRAGGTNFVAPEYDFLKPLMPCERAIHLQCAGGRDTLSLWNLGAREVVGVDINDDMIALGKRKSDALGAPARWFRSDILETWARVVFRLLKPGGHLYLFDGHPVSWVWDMEADHLKLDPEYGNYFDGTVHQDESGWPTTYIPSSYQPEKPTRKYERQWTLAQIVNAVVGAGLVLERLGEHPDRYWDAFPNLPSDLQDRLPQTLSVLARKP